MMTINEPLSRKLAAPLLVASALLLSPLCSAAATADEQANLELILRQLSMIEKVAQKSVDRPAPEGGRYHFDYQRLLEDLGQVRTGIQGYLSPTRAQPRDPGQLSGHYTRTGSDKP
ncbi:MULTISPECIES: RAQPRD family integrative conjugative element protein [Stutzerimonas]|jgi:RAQPRD family integrative conjugative element protein|uniref:integrative conjugative element protein, RAQPRD family n=1 Tax=Stutzerimonas TaxID=2901164 RepID=UPI001F3E5ABF|nr:MULTISPECIES: RAQPRD family integrative conjugative element protein [Stutzerimonas]MCQ2036643.1 RAQPRD family integrative conjugative element protein [Stutzerimonas kunmingensis]|tara:strand:- start:7867 stop:8214 length:348 start_codon:yes stop_codon:yes gene_type:complete